MAPRNDLDREVDRREKVEQTIFDMLQEMQRNISNNSLDIAVMKAKIAIYSGVIGVACGIIGAWGSEALKHFWK